MTPDVLLPYLPSPKNIGICGGSFSPPHIGHTMAVLYAMAMHDLDQVWVVPCGEHAEGKKLIDFGHRFKMCQIAFTRIRNCRVLHLEDHLPKPNYTNETLKFIKDHEPNARLHLILGLDTFQDLPKWKGGPETMQLAKLVAVPRSGFDNEGHLLPEISSTEIRAHLQKQESVERHLDFGVRDYIKKHNLYPALTKDNKDAA